MRQLLLEIPMAKALIEVVLPRLAKPLYKHLERFQTGKVDEAQFTSQFEAVLNRHHAWLSKKGIDKARAAVAIHAAVIILSQSGLRSEAHEAGIPIELLEIRAIREAAQDVVESYGMTYRKALEGISALVAKYGE
jgi:hypothetical protein